MIKTEIIADSVNEKGCRLTTFILEYPRFIHSEVMTHRVFSKNAASSRAIPFEKFVQQITDNPAMPEFWGKNQSGMQAVEELNNDENSYFVSDKKYEDLLPCLDNENIYDGVYFYTYKIGQKEHAKRLWLEARDQAINYARTLNNIGLHKQIVNRILEPWFHIRVILSGTEFGNFFALRAHKDAQPEFRVLAEKMLVEYNKSKPKLLKNGEWHIPFGDKIDDDRLNNLLFVREYAKKLDDMNFSADFTSHYYAKQEAKKKIAVARCARVSYFNFDGKDDYEADIKLCDRLFGNIPMHLSPTEHVAQATGSNGFIGNFRGFKQYRKFFNNENLNDDRIVKHDLN
jgi:thymidylate synthase ThyX